MSTTIDEKVVSIQFDNHKFEQNVSTTMSTLDKLKQKLNFTGASKGLEEINDASNKMNMNGLSRGIEAVQAKFSALEVIGVTALANITNSAVNAGKRIVSALTIAPVRSGFQEYETQINSVQTILANTESKGSTIKDVNLALEELNKYADMTIYNFTEMTRNIGTFTAAGIDLDTSVNAIKGIANLAAVSGSTSQQASTAMYQLSQALASGTVKLMDWNSVVNAGMGGQVFQDALKETARAHGIAVDQIIKQEGSFRESLKEGWLTAEVLTDTLQKFTLTTEGLTAEQIEANREMLKAKGYTEAQIEEIFKLGNTATNAATKVKTFTQLWDVMQEAAQSGWAQTWKLIVGDFEEAKSLLTPIADVFTTIINGVSDARNALLKSALGKSFTGLMDTINGVTAPIENVVDTLVDYEELATSIIRGDWGNGKARIDALSEAGYNYAKAQNLVNERLNCNVRISEDLYKQYEKQASAQKKIEKMGGKAVAALSKLSDEELIAAGYSKEFVSALRQLQREADKTGIPLAEFVDNLDQINGRFLLMNSFKNIGKAIAKVFTSIKNAWDAVFDPLSAETLYDMIAAFHKFTTELIPGEETLNKIQVAFEGVFTVVKFVKDVFVTIASAGAKLIGGLFKPFAKIVLTCATNFGKFVKSISSGNKDVLEPLRKTLDKIVTSTTNFANKLADNFDTISTTIIDTIGSWKSTFKETEVFKVLSGYIQEAATAIKGAIGTFKEFFEGINFEGISGGTKSIRDFVNGLITSFGNNEFLIKAIDGIAGAIKAFFGMFKGIEFKLPTAELESFADFITGKFGTLVNYLTTNNFTGIAGTTKGIFNWIKSLFVTDFNKKKSAALQNTTDFFVKAGDKIKAGFAKAAEVFQSIKEFIFGTKDVQLADILDVTNKIIKIVLLMQTLKMVNSITKVAENITGGFADLGKSAKNITASMKWRAVAEAFKGVAIAIGALTLCIVVLSKITDVDKAKQSALMIGGLILGISVAIGALMMIAKFSGGALDLASASLTLLAFAGAIGVLVWVLKIIDSTNFKNVDRSIGIMVGVMASLAISVGILGKLCGGTAIKAAGAIITMLMAAKLIPEILQQYAEYPWNTVKSGIPAMAMVLGSLALVCRAITVAGKDGSSVTGTALLLVSIVLSLKLLLGVIEDFGTMDTKVMWQGIKGIMALFGGITAMMVAITLSSKLSTKVFSTVDSISANFVGMASAILAIAATIYILGNMDTKALQQGGNAAGMILLMMSGIMFALGAAGGGNPFKGALPMLIGMGLIIYEMYYITRALSKIGWKVAVESAKALGILLTTLAVAMLAVSRFRSMKIKDLTQALGIMTVFSGLLLILGYTIKRMDGLSPEGAVASAAGLSLLLITMTGCLEILMKTNKYANSNAILKRAAAFAAIGTIALVLAASIRILKGLNPGQAIANAAALSLLLIAMAGCLAILAKIEVKSPKALLKIVGIMAVLGLVVAELALILGLLKLMGIDGGQALGQVVALAALLIAMAGCLVILNGIAKIAKEGDLLQVVGVMAVFGLVVTEMALVLGLMKVLGIDGGKAIGQVAALSILLIAMSACLAILGAVSMFAKEGDLLQSVGIMAVFGLVVTELSLVLGLLKAMGIDGGEAIQHVTALSLLLVAMSGCLILLGVVGTMSSFVTTGMATLAIFATGLIGFLAILGGIEALSDGGFSKIMDNAVDIMTKAGEAIGGFFGGIGAGMIEAVSSTLPQLGSDLSSFMNNASDFFDGIKKLDVEDVAKAALLAPIVGALEALGLINGIANIISIGKNLPNLGADLGSFFINATPFFDGLESMDESLINCANNLADTMMILTAADFLSGISSLLGLGDGSFDSFGTSLVGFGHGMTAFSDSISELDEGDIVQIDIAAEAGKKLAEFSEALPKEGGWIQKITGTSDMGNFGQSAASFGKSLVDFAASVSQLTDADVEAINRGAEAGGALANLAGKIPNEGGWAATIMGENNMADFGKRIVAFGNSLIEYAASVANLTEDDASRIESSADAGKALANLAGSIPNEGGWAATIMGENDMATFGEKVVAFGNSLVAYAQAISGLGEDDAANILASAECAQALATAANAIPKTDSGIWGAIAGEKDFEVFGNGMCSIANAIKKYSAVASTLGEDDATAIANSKSAIKAMVEVGDEIKRTGGLGEAIVGTKDIEGFSTGMSSLSTSIKSCVASARGIAEEDVAKEGPIYRMKKAIEALADAAKAMPNEGGLAGLLAGENSDIVKFSSDMTTLTSSVKTCITSARGITEEDTGENGPIYRLKRAIIALTDAAKSMPNEGGLVGLLAGENSDFGSFGSGMITLTNQIKTCITSARGITEEDTGENGPVYRLKRAIIALTDAAKSIPNEGGLVALLSGDNDQVATFGSGMVTLTNQVKSCIFAARGITEEDTGEGGAIYRLKAAIIALSDAAKAIPNEGGLVALLSGDNADMSGFGSSMITLTNQIKTCVASARGITEEDTGEGGTIGRLKSAITQLANAIPSDFVDNSSSVSILVQNIDGLVGAVGKMSTIDASATSGFISAVNNLGNLSVKELTSSISEGTTRVNTMFTEMLNKAAAAINNRQSQFKACGTTLITALANGIKSKMETVTVNALQAITNAQTAIKVQWAGFYAAGEFLGDGLVQGINSKKQAAYDAGYALGQAAVQGEKDGQQSNSPSKATIQAGHWMGEGLVIGLEEMGKKVYNAGSDLGSGASDSITGALTTAMDLLNSDTMSQPTIRPVLDLSEVQSGASTIGNMFGIQPSVGVLGNVNAINTGMDQMNQNGANDDVVSAIDKLRKDIGNMQGGNNYTVNGVTYDDGSNISAAVQSLVRAAKVERRI